MKIIYLHQYFNTPDMAGSTRSFEMARRLAGKGHEVHVITSWRESTETRGWFEEDLDGMRVHWLPVPYSNRMGYGKRMLAFASFAVQAAGRAVAIGADVVFATSTPLTIALPGVRAAKKLGVPMVFEVRDLWPEVPIAVGVLRNRLLISLARRLEKYAYANAARVVALSPGMAAGVVRTGYPPESTDIIPNSADLELFKHCESSRLRFKNSHPELGPGPIVLYPGTLGTINGVTYLARLAAAVRDRRPDLQFVVIGDGKEWAHVQNEARKLGVLNINFFMYPKMPKREVALAFAAAAMVISLVIDIPELWENSANKFFDALASGKAVAINHEGWQADLIRESNAGLVLPQDVHSAANALVAFFSDDSAVREAGERARQLAEDRFSRDLLADKLEGSLEKAISSASEHRAH